MFICGLRFVLTSDGLFTCSMWVSLKILARFRFAAGTEFVSKNENDVMVFVLLTKLLTICHRSWRLTMLCAECEFILVIETSYHFLKVSSSPSCEKWLCRPSTFVQPHTDNYAFSLWDTPTTWENNCIVSFLFSIWFLFTYHHRVADLI